MKKIIVAFLCLFAFASPVYALVIQGKSSATVDIKTNVEGNGSVSVHTDTIVNGKEQVVDSSKSGEIREEITSDGNSSPSVTITFTKSTTPSARVDTEKGVGHQIKNFFENIKNILKQFFFKLF